MEAIFQSQNLDRVFVPSKFGKIHGCCIESSIAEKSSFEDSPPDLQISLLLSSCRKKNAVAGRDVKPFVDKLAPLF